MSRKLSWMVILLVASLAPTLAGVAAEYDIDATHSGVYFKIKHMGISTVTGRFDTFSGAFDVDEKNLETLKASATIETASVDTDDEKRDAHLKTADFFNAEKFPQMIFVSKQVKLGGKDELSMTGDLTLLGVTKPVVLKTEFGGAIKDPWGKERAAFTARGKINRKDFGMTWNKALDTGGLVVGDEVEIIIEIEGIKK
jgi:polyisoprenoid-binding protein YceI